MSCKPINILLASSSPYRKRLLSQLGLEFEQVSPNIDETSYRGESAQEIATRLSIEKAMACQHNYPNYVIIASDQIASISGKDNHFLSKPKSHQNAIKQLQQCNNSIVRFYTGLCVLTPNILVDANQQHLLQQCCVETFDVHFRDLSSIEIEQYVRLEKPYNCAGSFKVEGLGIHLFKKLEGNDQSTLVGLPLIKLSEMLRNVNVNPLSIQR